MRVGKFGIHAASCYGVDVVGVTLSEQQAQLARKRVTQAGLEGRVTIRVQDYRDIRDGPYDAIASIGMVEHVGERRIDEYARCLARLLQPGGRLLNHGIAHLDHRYKGVGGFTDRYVFPDADPVHLSRILLALERAGFFIEHVEEFGQDYAETLRHWISRLDEHHDEAVRLAGEERVRIWQLYLRGARRSFETGFDSIYQVKAVKQTDWRKARLAGGQLTPPIPAHDLPAPPDLSKLRINRDVPPPQLQRAVGRTVVLALAALVLVLGGVLYWRRSQVATVQVVTATPVSGGEGGAGSASVTANGYVVARTRASVSAKLPGRIASLRVSEGSSLRRGEDHRDAGERGLPGPAGPGSSGRGYCAGRPPGGSRESVGRSSGGQAAPRYPCGGLEGGGRAGFRCGSGRESEASARVQSAETRINSARAAAGFALANLENTVIRAPFTGTVLRKEAEVGEVVAPRWAAGSPVER